MTTKGKLISSSITKAFNSLKPQLKQFTSELSTTAKQIGAQQVQAVASNYLQKTQALQQQQPQQRPSFTQQAVQSLVTTAMQQQQPFQPSLPTPPSLQQQTVTTLPPPTPAVPPIVENIVKASNESFSSVNNMMPSMQQQQTAPKTEIASGVSLKPGIVAESVMHSKDGNVTHALLKDITPKPFYKKTWFIVTMILVVILIMAAIGLTIYLVVRARDKKNEENK